MADKDTPGLCLFQGRRGGHLGMVCRDLKQEDAWYFDQVRRQVPPEQRTPHPPDQRWLLYGKGRRRPLASFDSYEAAYAAALERFGFNDPKNTPKPATARKQALNRARLRF